LALFDFDASTLNSIEDIPNARAASPGKLTIELFVL
jgi:hypothetical protein